MDGQYTVVRGVQSINAYIIKRVEKGSFLLYS